MRKTVWCIVTMITLAILLTCCSPTEVDGEHTKEPTPATKAEGDMNDADATQEMEEVVTTIYLLEFDKYISKAVPLYNVVNRDNHCRVEFQEFPMDQMESMYDRLTQEILAGGGPDIIYYNRFFKRYVDIQRAAKQGALADLDELIAKDDDMSMEDYDDVVMDVGIIDDKRVLLPASYNVDYLLGLKETFDYHGIKVPQKWTMDEYLGILEAYYASTTTEPAMLGYHYSDPVELLQTVIDDGELDEDAFLRMARVLKQEHVRYMNTSFGRMRMDEYCAWHLANNYLFLPARLQGGSEFFNVLCTYTYAQNCDANLVVFEFPGKKHLDSGFMINAHSNYKKEALDFIQYMLGEEPQSEETAAFSGLPVNRKAYENRKKDLDERYKNFYGSKLLPIPEDMRANLYTFIESIDTCDDLGYETFLYNNFIQEQLLSYYTDEIDETELVESIKSKLFIYYSE